MGPADLAVPWRHPRPPTTLKSCTHQTQSSLPPRRAAVMLSCQPEAPTPAVQHSCPLLQEASLAPRQVPSLLPLDSRQMCPSVLSTWQIRK